MGGGLSVQLHNAKLKQYLEHAIPPKLVNSHPA